MKILYPGTFDPLTNGHVDLIDRAEKIFGNLVVAVLENTSTTPTFNIQRRILQIKNCLSHLPNIEVISYSGLTVDCANDLKANLILRGLRAMSDLSMNFRLLIQINLLIMILKLYFYQPIQIIVFLVVH